MKQKKETIMATVTSIPKPAQMITPAMRQSINKARREYAKGKTITCRTAEEMQRYFDSLWYTAHDRIIYDIYDDRVTVLVVQAEEHYNDK